MLPLNFTVPTFGSKILPPHTINYCFIHIYKDRVANSERHYLQEHRIKAPKLTGSRGNCVLIVWPILNVNEPAHFVRLCSTRVTVLRWHGALETAIKILLVRGRILLRIELVHLTKTSVCGSQCRFVILPWGPGRQVQLRSSQGLSWAWWYPKPHLPACHLHLCCQLRPTMDLWDRLRTLGVFSED